MGQLISRAFRRFTQCQSGNQAQQQLQQQQETREQAQRQRERESRPTVQQIPVGQSIDSADYAAFEASRQTTKPKIAIQSKSDDGVQAERENNIAENQASKVDQTASKTPDGSKPQVEEAAIKIQAYVRGHLTRKALKDAQQQNSTVSPNTLGQSQFDEESLMKNPSTGRITPKLESIAEESQNQTSIEKKDKAGDSLKDESAHKPTSQRQSLSLQVDDDIAGSGSMSPVTSEANASIDLNCDTPASASIDIADHCSQPTDKMASVLHFRASPVPMTDDQVYLSDNPDHQSSDAPQVIESAPPQEQTNYRETEHHASPPVSSHISQNALMNSSSHSIDSAEAAAIRIQSAFRGYHTRKHSPYRRRSPNSLPSTALGNNGYITEENNSPQRRAALRQQDATEMDDERDGGAVVEMDPQSQAQLETEREMLDHAEQLGRRQSRQRQRDVNLDESVMSLEDQSVATDDSTIKEAHPETGLELNEENSGAALSDDISNHDMIPPLKEPDSRRTSDLDETGLSSALEADSSKVDDLSSNIQEIQQNQQPVLTKAVSQRTASVDLDTESSNLGAALSMNEETCDNQVDHHTPEEMERGMELVQSQDKQDNNEDDSQSYSTSANLVEETSIQEQQNENGLIEKESAGNDEAEKKPDSNDSAQVNSLDQYDSEATKIDKDIDLDEESQRMLELESDDIELRDPRGQASDGRIRSPQSRLDQSGLISTSDSHANVQAGSSNEAQSRLTVESPDEAFASGPSSPALVSSIGATSSEDEAESDIDRECAEKLQEKNSTNAPSVQGQSGAKNRKRNRNKKKNKK